MPFDDTGFLTPKTLADFPFARGDQGLLNLAGLLEAEQLWRDKIISWNFKAYSCQSDLSPCGTAGCALGLAEAAWPEYRRVRQSATLSPIAAQRVFDLNLSQISHLFGGVMGLKHGGLENVTPGMVVAAIREFVAARQARAAS